MYRKKYSICRIWYYLWFLASTKDLGLYSPGIMGTVVFKDWNTNVCVCVCVCVESEEVKFSSSIEESQ